MTATQKANELFGKYIDYLSYRTDLRRGCNIVAKQLAIMCVIEIMKDRQNDPPSMNWWGAVKDELNKL